MFTIVIDALHSGQALLKVTRNPPRIPKRLFTKRIRTIEHPFPIRHLAGLPLAEITCEGRRMIEHRLHIRHVASLPVAEITVK